MFLNINYYYCLHQLLVTKSQLEVGWSALKATSCEGIQQSFITKLLSLTYKTKRKLQVNIVWFFCPSSQLCSEIVVLSFYLPPHLSLFFLSQTQYRTPINLYLPCLTSHIPLLLHFRHFIGVNHERETKASQVTVVSKKTGQGFIKTLMNFEWDSI